MNSIVCTGLVKLVGCYRKEFALHTTARNSAPTDRNRLNELLQAFGCADVVAPVDADAFARSAGELICRTRGKIVTRKKGKTSAGKFRLLALQCDEVAAQTRDPYAKDMLTVVARELGLLASSQLAQLPKPHLAPATQRSITT